MRSLLLEERLIDLVHTYYFYYRTVQSVRTDEFGRVPIIHPKLDLVYKEPLKLEIFS